MPGSARATSPAFAVPTTGGVRAEWNIGALSHFEISSLSTSALSLIADVKGKSKMALDNREVVESAAAQLSLAQTPEAIGSAVASLIIANNPQYAALAGLLAAVINAVLLGVPVQVKDSSTGSTTPTRTGGLFGWVKKLLVGA
jgi:hypothetical protein